MCPVNNFPDRFLSWRRLKNESTLVLLVDALSLPRVILSLPRIILSLPRVVVLRRWIVGEAGVGSANQRGEVWFVRVWVWWRKRRMWAVALRIFSVAEH